MNNRRLLLNLNDDMKKVPLIFTYNSIYCDDISFFMDTYNYIKSKASITANELGALCCKLQQYYDIIFYPQGSDYPNCSYTLLSFIISTSGEIYIYYAGAFYGNQILSFGGDMNTKFTKYPYTGSIYDIS